MWHWTRNIIANLSLDVHGPIDIIHYVIDIHNYVIEYFHTTYIDRSLISHVNCVDIIHLDTV